MAISEFANNKWQPKKISKEGITTPKDYSNCDKDFIRDKYSLMFFESVDQIWLFSSIWYKYEEMNWCNGIFNLTGCKGYPELLFEGKKMINDFFPDFEECELRSNRYFDLNDKLSVKNALTFFQFQEILKKNPDPCRISYPHQVTMIDIFALIFQYLLLQVLNASNGKLKDMSIKLPLGTLLPYFIEDSNHAYVIIPGFYKINNDQDTGDSVLVKRTSSNILQLIEDIISLFKKYKEKFAKNPDINALLQELMTDNDYHKIVDELKIYGDLKYGEQFKNMYHPLVCPLRATLYKHGIPELMKRETQLQITNFDFEKYYNPNTAVVPKTYMFNEAGVETLSYPVEDLDFTSDGSYSGYNWELFFHVPFLLATRLTRNQRFEEALTWFHYMFNPTGALDGPVPQKYWVTKPFYGLCKSKDRYFALQYRRSLNI